MKITQYNERWYCIDIDRHSYWDLYHYDLHLMVDGYIIIWIGLSNHSINSFSI